VLSPEALLPEALSPEVLARVQAQAPSSLSWRRAAEVVEGAAERVA
jgi:hypothetical protein